MFGGLKRLGLAIKAEERRLMKRNEWLRLPLLIFNKGVRERKKPGPKVDWWKRSKKVEALVSRLKCQGIITKLSSDLIENWFSNFELGYSMDRGKNDIPIPHWYISRGGRDFPQLTAVNFYLETEFKKGRPVNPHLKIEINVTPEITLSSEFWTITIDEVYRQIIEMFTQVYGDFAKKKGIQLS